MKKLDLNELLPQALETELGGERIYQAAIECAQNEDLKEEWQKYLEQTTDHVQIVRDLMNGLGMDPEAMTPGREIVRQKAESLLAAMAKARSGGEPEAAELVACECVVDAETKDHLNWELIGEAAKKSSGEVRQELMRAYEKVEDQEDEHLYHSMGWARELWCQALGLPAVLPPPEEKRDVKTAIGAARAKSARSRMIRSQHKKSA